MTTKNDVTGDSLITKAPTDAYRSNYDAIFKKSKQAHVPETRKLVHDVCFECGALPHKMDCSSKAVFDAYILLRDTDKWKYFTESMLNAVEFKVWTEQQDRKYSNMFDKEEE